MTDSPKFAEAFDSYVCEGDSIALEHDGFRIVARIFADDDATPPWDREDGHGPVSEWERRDKAPGERILSEDGRAKRFYDFAEAVKIARRDGWGARPEIEGETAGQKAARAAEHDFKVLEAWCDDEWHYCGVALQVFKGAVDLTGEYGAALWGIEANYPGSKNEYLTETANDLIPEALAEARKALAALQPDSEAVDAIVADLLAYEAEAFEDDDDVNGADLVDAFTAWRGQFKALFPHLAPAVESDS